MLPKKVGQGAYGCVYSPPIKCTGSERTVGKVSKLIPEENANDEVRNLERFHLERLDPNEDFFIYKNETCRPDPRDLLTITGKDICPVPDVNTIILYKNGGRDSTKASLKQALCGMENILKGLKLLIGANICHCDVKPPNIVIDSLGKCRLIDFGISCNKDGILHSVNETFSNAYAYWPPESIFLYEVPPVSLDWYKYYFHVSSYANGVIRVGLNDSYYKQIRNKDKNVAMLDKLRAMHREEVISKVMEKLDIFSAGITLADYLSKGHLEPGVDYRPLYEVIVGMLLPLDERYDIEQAYNAYRKVLPLYVPEIFS